MPNQKPSAADYDVADFDIIIIGAGAAGLLCATRTAERGLRTLLLEKNTKAGVKILMSGGTRCNLTHDATSSEIADAYAQLVGGKLGKQKARFLRAALAHLSPDMLVALFAAEGLPTKVEATGKVFPESDRALDVQRTLLTMLGRSGAELALKEGVESIDRQDDGSFLVATTERTLRTAKLVIAVGGRSYPGCGTTGDGYAWAKTLGHRIVPPRPALAPLTANCQWAAELQGVTLPDVRLCICEGDARPVVERRSSLLFTHFGLSGPAAMDASRFVTERPGAGWIARCDFVPAIDEETLRSTLQDPANGSRRLFKLLTEWVPKRLAETIVTEAGVPLDRQLAELAKHERMAILTGLKRSPIPLAGSLGFKKAEVTAGGVDLSEVDPRTMQSRLVPGLFFAGEILDLDGPIGGYNFQAAFSTGSLAGESV